MHKPDASRCSILLGAEQSEFSKNLYQLLAGWGHAVEHLGEAQRVLDRLEEPESPSVVVLDSDLPGLGWLEVIRQIQARSKPNLPWTMVLCGSPSCDQVLIATDAGVDDLLAKPIDELDLRIRLHTAHRVQMLHARLRHSVDAARFHASHDPLTGLWNREAMLRLLFQETDRVQRMRTPLALILLDVDDFSALNAEHGYPAGDRVLQQLAVRFRRYLRSYDLIGRTGEDSFLVALPGCTLAEAMLQAERLRKAVTHRPFEVPGTSVYINASFGVAQSLGRSPLVVLREAERALVQSKLLAHQCQVAPREPASAEVPSSLQP